MIKETLQDQFDNIKKRVKLNLESISNLIDQSDNLKKMIENTDLSLDKDIKENLLKIRASMVGSINDLVEHTDSLLRSYDDIIDKILLNFK